MGVYVAGISAAKSYKINTTGFYSISTLFKAKHILDSMMLFTVTFVPKLSPIEVVIGLGTS